MGGLTKIVLSVHRFNFIAPPGRLEIVPHMSFFKHVVEQGLVLKNTPRVNLAAGRHLVASVAVPPRVFLKPPFLIGWMIGFFSSVTNDWFKPRNRYFLVTLKEKSSIGTFSNKRSFGRIWNTFTVRGCFGRQRFHRKYNEFKLTTTCSLL